MKEKNILEIQNNVLRRWYFYDVQSWISFV